MWIISSEHIQQVCQKNSFSTRSLHTMLLIVKSRHAELVPDKVSVVPVLDYCSCTQSHSHVFITFNAVSFPGWCYLCLHLVSFPCCLCCVTCASWYSVSLNSFPCWSCHLYTVSFPCLIMSSVHSVSLIPMLIMLSVHSLIPMCHSCPVDDWWRVLGTVLSITKVSSEPFSKQKHQPWCWSVSGMCWSRCQW